MPLCVQTITVHKMCILHSQTGCTLIHPVYKLLLVSAYVFGHSNAGIVGAGYSNTFEHCFNCLYLARLKKHLRAAHRRSVFGDCHFIIQTDASFCKSVKDQKHCHDFRHACRRTCCVRILFKYYRSGRCFHKNSRRSSNFNCCFRLLLSGSLPGFILGILLLFLIISIHRDRCIKTCQDHHKSDQKCQNPFHFNPKPRRIICLLLI